MNPALFLLIVVAGGLGSLVRFVVDGVIARSIKTGFPWGIFVINTTGSLLLGFFTGLADSSVIDAPLLFIAGAGFLGGYTTFSTAMVDTVAMLRERRYGAALLNGGGLLLIGVAAAALGLAVGRSF